MGIEQVPVIVGNKPKLKTIFCALIAKQYGWTALEHDTYDTVLLIFPRGTIDLLLIEMVFKHGHFAFVLYALFVISAAQGAFNKYKGTSYLHTSVVDCNWSRGKHLKISCVNET